MAPQLGEWRVGPPETDPRVLLADADPLSRHVLTDVLGRSGQLRSVTGVDLAAPLRRWPLAEVDVAVLNLAEGQERGRAVRELTAQGVKVLVVAGGWTKARLAAALAAGAAGCLARDARVGRLVPAVRAVAAGHAVLSPELLALDHRPPATEPAPTEEQARQLLRTLTEREHEVLVLLAGGSSTPEVAAALGVAPATVKSHITHALGKLGARNRLEAVLLVQRESA
ncbi:DNA-binding response regulator [Kitasatospora sp. MMS16-BH015]|uniref:helix-turn-helix transcriptional regulator n=1 Tax=Kitasatospora sp. MMS16-BH015 TaxID=2018025 RepID=UPI000CA34363|nr:response regulator transcription factor [Kitasatospora sp. MMS16-BH015]AUG79799.1 DNA-binding response regulator [Kitasatospora sp. MMS16-BH015]